MRHRLIFALSALLVWAAPSPAGERGTEAVEALLAALAPVDRLQGRFEQRQYNDDGEQIAASSGQFRLLRPGYFAWEIQQPDRQLIVADPDYVWHLDRDLNTVTRRPADSPESMAPLQILGGDEEALRAAYRVERTGPERFELTPVAQGGGFESLSLQFREGAIASMTVRDELQQKIVIDFGALDSAAPLRPADFAFEPPPGADLFYHDR